MTAEHEGMDLRLLGPVRAWRGEGALPPGPARPGAGGGGEAMRAEHGGMDLRRLGRVRAWRGEAELPLGSARRAAVLAVLALHAGHAVSRQQLVTALWGDEPP